MGRTKLVIGCPSFERAWCLPLWFESIKAQELHRTCNVTFCFAYTKSYDGTFDILERRASELGDVMIYEFNLPTYKDRDLARLPMLTQIRNGLLDMVREEEPDYFLSWDDDIIFPPNVMHHMFTVAKSDRAVGALMDMGGNDEVLGYPSVMNFPKAMGEIAYRQPTSEYDFSKPFQCDIIMAVKLMGKEVYQNTHYQWDPVGEDIGWSRSADTAEYERWLQPATRGIHLYDKDLCLAVMKQFPQADYPEIMYPLSHWYKPPEERQLNSE